MTDYSFRGIACSKAESDTACWGVNEVKGSLKRFYFKLPSLKPNEARIKVLHAGLCHTDCSCIDAIWCPTVVYPLVPGHEIVAEIDKVGEDVKNFKSGDIVCFGVFRDCCGKCEFCESGDDQLCINTPYKSTYDPYLGGYSTYMHVRSDYLFPIPNKLPQHKVAPLLCAGTTVFTPLKRWARPGARCGVIGIGGLGHLAVQIANKMGMHVVAISGSTTKEQEARVFGAQDFICSKNESDMKRIKGPEKLDFIINTAPTVELTEYLYALKPNGRFVQVAAPEVAKPLMFNHFDLVVNQKTLSGSAVGSRKDVEDTLNFCNDFNIYPMVENYTWNELPKAYQRLHDGLPRYRCVVDVGTTYDNS